jgi:hypothetical protein
MSNEKNILRFTNISELREAVCSNSLEKYVLLQLDNRKATKKPNGTAEIRALQLFYRTEE